MDPTEVVVGNEECNHRLVVVELLAVAARAPNMPTELGPQRQIDALDIVRRDMRHIGMPMLDRIASRLLVHHDVIDICPEGHLNRISIGGQGIGHNLWPIDDPAPHVGHKRLPALRGPFPD